MLTQQFDEVALTEFRIPDPPTSGFDLALKLRSQSCTCDIPIIMLTARNFAKDVLRGREVGAAGYITKPFSTNEVIQRVRALLTHPS